MAAGGTLRLPSGICIASNLTIALAGSYQPINIEGLGTGMSRLLQKSSASGTFINVTAASQWFVPLRWNNLMIQCNGNANTCVALPAIYGGTFSDMIIGYTSTIGVQLNGTESWTFNNVAVQNAATCVNAVRTGGYSPNLIKWLGGQFATCTTRAIAVDHANSWLVQGVNFIGNGTAGNLSTGTISFTNPGQDAQIGPYLAVRDSYFEQDNGNSEIEATTAYFQTAMEITSDVFVSGGVAGPPYSVYVSGGSLLLTSSSISSSGGGVGHQYQLTATAMESTIVLNTRASYVSLPANAITQPYPTNGNNFAVISAGMLEVLPGSSSGVKAQILQTLNGDAVGPQDNIPKNGSAGNWAINADGHVLILWAAGLATPPDVSWGCTVGYNTTTTPLICQAGATSGVNLTWAFHNATTGAVVDLTTIIAGKEVDVDFTYRRQ